jgi:hypothetical protein
MPRLATLVFSALLQSGTSNLIRIGANGDARAASPASLVEVPHDVNYDHDAEVAAETNPGVNLARSCGPLFQDPCPMRASSTNPKFAPPDAVVDGAKLAKEFWKSEFTDDTHAWFMVDLQRTNFIADVVMYGADDTLGNFMKLMPKLAMEPDVATAFPCGMQPSTLDPLKSDEEGGTQYFCNRPARYVFIQKEMAGAMALSELEIHGMPDLATFCGGDRMKPCPVEASSVLDGSQVSTVNDANYDPSVLFSTASGKKQWVYVNLVHSRALQYVVLYGGVGASGAGIMIRRGPTPELADSTPCSPKNVAFGERSKVNDPGHVIPCEGEGRYVFIEVNDAVSPLKLQKVEVYGRTDCQGHWQTFTSCHEGGGDGEAEFQLTVPDFFHSKKCKATQKQRRGIKCGRQNAARTCGADGMSACPTTASTTWSDMITEKAVDGQTSLKDQRGTCYSSQKEIRPWWRLDMGKTRIVESVELFASTLADSPIDDVKVYVSSSSEIEIARESVCTSVNADGATGGIYFLNCDENMSGRYLWVEGFFPKEDFLVLCEVEVYARYDYLKSEV